MSHRGCGVVATPTLPSLRQRSLCSTLQRFAHCLPSGVLVRLCSTPDRQHKREVYQGIGSGVAIPLMCCFVLLACILLCFPLSRSLLTPNRGMSLLGTLPAFPDPLKTDHRYDTLAEGWWWD